MNARPSLSLVKNIVDAGADQGPSVIVESRLERPGNPSSAVALSDGQEKRAGRRGPVVIEWAGKGGRDLAVIGAGSDRLIESAAFRNTEKAAFDHDEVASERPAVAHRVLDVSPQVCPLAIRQVARLSGLAPFRA